jgi:hypothetical protein
LCDEFVCFSLGSAASHWRSSVEDVLEHSLVEVDLLRLIRLVVNRLHVLRMHSGVGVVEHLLHCRQHRLVDVGRRRKHHLLFSAVLLHHHSVRLLDDHARVFNRLVGVVRNKAVVGGVGGAAGGWNGAGVDVGIDDGLVVLLVMGLVITWRKESSVSRILPRAGAHRTGQPKETITKP